MFLDHTGRRRRFVTALGSIAAVACTAWLAALIAGGFGFSNLPALRTAGQLASRQAAPARHLAARGGRRHSLNVAATGAPALRLIWSHRGLVDVD